MKKRTYQSSPSLGLKKPKAKIRIKNKRTSIEYTVLSCRALCSNKCKPQGVSLQKKRRNRIKPELNGIAGEKLSK